MSIKVDPDDRPKEAAVPTSNEKQTTRRAGLPKWLSRLTSPDYFGILVATVTVIVVVGLLHPDFLKPAQLLNVLNAATFIGVIACGMAFLLAMREIDLTPGATLAFSGVIVAIAVQQGLDPWLASVLGIAVGGAVGLVNGLVVQFFRLPSIVATLAMAAIVRGLAIAVSNASQILGPPQSSTFAQFFAAKLLGVPTNVYILIFVVVVLSVVLRSTVFGYRVRSIGSNPQAAAFAGIPVERTRLQVFVVMGVLGGLAGVMTLGYFGAADPTVGTGYELQAIAAAVIGGTSLSGGRATIVGAAIGATLLSVVAAGLAFFNVPLQWSSFATGSVIVLAVCLDSIVRRARRQSSRA